MKYDYIIKNMKNPYDKKWLYALTTIRNKSISKHTINCDCVECDDCPFSFMNRKNNDSCNITDIKYEDIDSFLYRYISYIKQNSNIYRLNI